MSMKCPTTVNLLVLGCFGIVSLHFTGSANGRQVFQSLDRVEPKFAAQLGDATTAVAKFSSTDTDKCPVVEKCDCQSPDLPSHKFKSLASEHAKYSATTADQMWASQQTSAGELDAIRDAAGLSMETVAETCSLADTTKNYCRHTARLLTITLRSADTGASANSDSIQQAIEAALLLVAETTSAQAEVKIAQLEAEHAGRIAALQFSSQQRSDQSAVTNHQSSPITLQQYLTPMLAKVTNSEAQLASIANQQAMFQENLNQLQEKFDRANAIPPQVIANPMFREPTPTSPTVLTPLRESAVSAQPDIEPSLQQQIARLQLQLQEVRQQDARSARQLEPLYSSDKPLFPLFQR